jgi:hypothetical protein
MEKETNTWKTLKFDDFSSEEKGDTICLFSETQASSTESLQHL